MSLEPQPREVGPTVVVPGERFVIVGRNLHLVIGVLLGGIACNFSISSPNTISAVCPSGVAPGRQMVECKSPRGSTYIAGTMTVVNEPPLFVPEVYSYSPSSGEISASITITGLNFTGATVVAFNGTSASFVVVDDTTIIATVPNGATTGPVSVTNADGTGAGPSFTIDPNNFAFDLSAPIFPAGLSLSRTGDTAYPQRSATTVEATPGAAIREDYGDGNGSGFWTFPAYYNAAAPFDFLDASWDPISTPTITANDGVAPDGTTTADKIEDSSAAAAQGLWRGGSTAPGDDRYSVASVWVKDASPAPSAPGVIGALAGGDTVFWGKDLGSGSSAWRRVWASWYKPSTTGGFEYIGILPAGAAPRAPGDANIDLTPSATGARHFWGAQAARGYALLPLIDGDTGDSLIEAVTPANVLAANGDLHIEGEYLMDPVSGGAIVEQDAWKLFHLVAASGVYAIAYGGQLVMNGTFRSVPAGTSGASRNVGVQTQNKGFRWELWYRPSTNDYGMQFWTNGMREANNTYRNTGGVLAIGAVSAFYLGHEGGTKILPRRHTMLRKTTKSLDAADGVLLGDSIVSTYSAEPSVASFIYTAQEARARDGIVSYAFPGQTIAQQTTTWQACAQRGDANLNWGWFHLGINSLASGGLSAAAATAQLQTLINDFNGQNPGKPIVLSPILPCRAAVGDVVWAKAVEFNANIAGTGPNPISGSNLIVLPYWTAADDGTGNLIALYDSGDGIHENTAGRQYMAAIVRAALVTAGLL